MSTTAHAATGVDSASAIDFEVPAPGSNGYEEWRKTGKLPDSAESAPVEEEKPKPSSEVQPEEEAEAGAAEHVDTEAESAPAHTQGKKKDAAARLKEVLAERKKDRELIDQLTRKLTAQPSAEPTSRTAAEPQVKPKVEAKAKPKRPKLADTDAQGKPVFKTYGEFETAVEKYEDELDQWNRGELLRVVEENSTKAQKTQQAQEAEKVIAQGWQSRVAEARKKYADFDDVALDDTLPIHQGSVADQFILSSKYGTDVAYYLGQNRSELEAIVKLNPLDQARALFAIEQQFEKKPAASSKPPVKPVTQAPRVPHQVSGKGPIADPVAKAVEEGDQRAYTEAENAKALAAWKSRRR